MTPPKVVASIVLVLIPLAALAADASGTWTATFDTQVGQQSYTYTFMVKGTQLTGRAKSANGDVEITEGKVDGNTLSFVENLNFQGMDLRIVYKGTLASDSEIKFTRTVADIIMEEFVAKRSK
jgi:hypothetical protein